MHRKGVEVYAEQPEADEEVPAPAAAAVAADPAANQSDTQQQAAPPPQKAAAPSGPAASTKLPPVDADQQAAYREAAKGLVNLLRGSGHAKTVSIYTQGDSTMWRQTR